MEVTDKMTFTEYWHSPDYAVKRPVRNGSSAMLVGDNIYHRDHDGSWMQEDSHHSSPDGSPDVSNLRADTATDAVLLSRNFYYFGKAALEVPPNFLVNLGFSNARNHRNFPLREAQPLIDFIRANGRRNYLEADPFDFHHARGRYSAATNRVTIQEDA